jgi:general secretion pathway protein G
LAREITASHKVDPTIVFSPERHEALRVRARMRKRMIVAGIIAMAVLVGGSISYQSISSHRRESEKLMARARAAQRELSTLADALERFKADVQRYPTNEEGLQGLARKPAVVRQDSEHLNYWFGPYLDSVPEVDPWGNDYIYHTMDGGRSFELFSYGPDGETGSDSRFQVISPGSADDR